MNLVTLLPQILLVLGVGFLIANIRMGIELLRWRRRRAASVITWNATADQPWVILSAATGATGETLTVSRDPSVALGDGEHTATITLTSPQLPDASVTIPVLADIVMRPTRIPLIMR